MLFTFIALIKIKERFYFKYTRRLNVFCAFPVLVCEWFAFTICSASKSDIVPHWYHALHAAFG